MTEPNLIVFTPLDDYVHDNPSVFGAFVGRYSEKIEHHATRSTPEHMKRTMVGAIDMHLNWVVKSHHPYQLEVRGEENNWNLYVKNLRSHAFFDTTYEFPGYKVKVMSISTAFVIAIAYEKGGQAVKSMNRAMRRLLKKLLPRPKVTVVSTPHLHVI